MSTARNGRNREYLVRRHLERYGWRQLMRAAGSKGSADLAMVHAAHGLALVQVGTATKKLGPADRARFVADAADAGALALLATVLPGVGVHYFVVTGAKPAAWHRWEPGAVA